MRIPEKQHSWTIFDRIFKKYDLVNRILSFGCDMRWRRRLANYLPKDKALNHLDVATGTGDQIGALLEKKIRFDSITGVDLSKNMLSCAREKFPKVNFVLASAENLAFENGQFDTASFSFGIRNVEHPDVALSEIFRVLKPKGTLLVLEFSLPKQPLRALHLFYLRTILPRIGKLLTKDPVAYSYLNQTIETFPFGPAFCKWMEEAGFRSVRSIPMNFGAVTLYVGEKP